MVIGARSCHREISRERTVRGSGEVGLGGGSGAGGECVWIELRVIGAWSLGN